MSNVHNVAAAILSRFNRAVPQTNLHRYLYIAQGYHLGFTGSLLLFKNDFEAWESGPICREIFEKSPTPYGLGEWRLGDETALTASENIIVDSVVNKYGALGGVQLGHLALVQGVPWARARDEKRPICNAEIAEHYTSVLGITKDEQDYYFTHMESSV